MSKSSRTYCLISNVLILGIMLFVYTIQPPTILDVKVKAVDGCPLDNTDGVYFIRGKDTDGSIICGFEFNNPCPYTQAVSADNHTCYKNKHEESTENITTQNEVEDSINDIKQQTIINNTNDKPENISTILPKNTCNN